MMITLTTRILLQLMPKYSKQAHVACREEFASNGDNLHSNVFDTRPFFRFFNTFEQYQTYDDYDNNNNNKLKTQINEQIQFFKASQLSLMLLVSSFLLVKCLGVLILVFMYVYVYLVCIV